MKDKKQKNLLCTVTFGDRLRKLRKDKGLKQSELAEALGYKRNVTISNIENDKATVDNKILAKMAELLNVDLHWLITGQDSTEKDITSALEMLTDKESLDEFYATQATKATEARKVAGALESKRLNGERLTDDEIKLLSINEKTQEVLFSLLGSLTTYNIDIRFRLEALLNDLRRIDPEKPIKNL